MLAGAEFCVGFCRSWVGLAEIKAALAVVATKTFFLRRNAKSSVGSIKAPGSYEFALDSTHARALWIS